jgi:hypothetical protein
MKPQDLIVSEFGPVFKDAGFRKQRATWRRVNTETIFVVNLQRSRWGDNFYVNLGVHLRMLEEAPDPAHNECHLSCRAEAVPEALPVLRLALDFDRGFDGSEHERRSAVRALAHLSLLRLGACETLAQARAAVSGSGVRDWRIRVEARDLLGLPAF